MQLSQTTGLLIVVALLILGAAAYLMFGTEDAASVLNATDTSVSVAELTFLNLAAQIEPVAFNSSILTDPRFMELQDLRTAILPEVSGRIDPFAAFGQ
ncbi:MAG: hypothetical protein WBK28_03680 [Minisyncoccia bacterium]